MTLEISALRTSWRCKICLKSGHVLHGERASLWVVADRVRRAHATATLECPARIPMDLVIFDSYSPQGTDAA